jgi:hypothetical protein
VIEASPNISTAEELFGAYGVSQRDLARYRALISAGEWEDAISDFLERYVSPYAEDYERKLVDYIQTASQGELSPADLRKTEESVTELSVALAVLLAAQYDDFVRQSVAASVFSARQIAATKVRDAILRSTIGQFQSLTRGAMARTEFLTLESIRNLQTEMVIENQRIGRMRLAGEAQRAEIAQFRRLLRERHPQIFSDMEAGRVLKDRRGRPYKLSDYVEMSVRTTTLNVERTAVEISEKLRGAKIVEYVLSDPRAAKEPREICAHYLASKTSGKSLMALDAETGKLLGIPTIGQARAAGAMGPNCRHGLRPVSNTFAKKILAKAAA